MHWVNPAGFISESLLVFPFLGAWREVCFLGIKRTGSHLAEIKKGEKNIPPLLIMTQPDLCLDPPRFILCYGWSINSFHPLDLGMGHCLSFCCTATPCRDHAPQSTPQYQHIVTPGIATDSVTSINSVWIVKKPFYVSYTQDPSSKGSLHDHHRAPAHSRI